MPATMAVGVGISLIVAGAALGLVDMFILWRRLPAAVALGAMSLCGALIGAGGLLVQDAAGLASWIVALAILSVLGPVHGRLVFGPAGPRRSG